MRKRVHRRTGAALVVSLHNAYRLRAYSRWPGDEPCGKAAQVSGKRHRRRLDRATSVAGPMDDVFVNLPTPPFTEEEKGLVANNVYAHVWQQAMSGSFAMAA